MPDRMAPLDGGNKLIGIANNTERTTWGGIAHRYGDGAFLAVQERRASNNSSAPRLLPLLFKLCFKALQ